MDYRLVVVVACVVLAGCSGGVDSNGDSGTPVPDAETAVPDTESVSYPASFTENGTTAADAAVDAHESRLLERANYSVRWQFLVWENESIVSNNTIDGEVSPAEARALYHLEEADGNGEITGYHRDTYFADGLQRTYSLDSESVVSEEERNFSSFVFVYGDQVRTYLESVDLEATNVDQQGGSTVITYDVVGLSEKGTDQFDAASGTVRVTNDGQVVAVDIRTVDGDDVRTFRYVVSDVNRTTVRKPGWVDEVD